jgi:hypothetical protein
MLVIHECYPLEEKYFSCLTSKLQIPDSLEQDVATGKEDEATGRFLDHGTHFGAF